MRERVHRGAMKGVQLGRRGVRKGWRGFIYFITDDKTIHGVVMAGVFAIIQLTIANIVALLNFVIGGTTQLLPHVPKVTLPSITLQLIFIIAVVRAAYWADAHTDAWREMVTETTGEEVADGEAGDND